MTLQELMDGIKNVLAKDRGTFATLGDYIRRLEDDAFDIKELFKEAGWIPSEKVLKVSGNEVEDFIKVGALEKWAYANGYVKLADDQSVPQEGCSNYMLLGDEGRKAWDRTAYDRKQAQQDMLPVRDGKA